LDVTPLKSAIEKERRAASEAEKRAKAYSALGKSPEEIQELLAAQQKADEERAAKAGEWDKLKEQMNQKHANDLKAKDDEVAKMRSSLEEYLVDADATRAIAEAKGVPALLLPHVKACVRVVEENGKYKPLVVDPKGDPRVNGKGEYLTISDLVGEMRQSEIFGRAFEGNGPGGSGTPPNGQAGGTGRADLSKLPPMERLRLHRERESTRR
jgi:hypothetical protein